MLYSGIFTTFLHVAAVLIFVHDHSIVSGGWCRCQNLRRTTTVLDARLLLCLEEEQRGACLMVPPPGKWVMIFVGVEENEEIRANFGGCCYRAVVLLNVDYYSTAEAESHAFSNHQFTGLHVNISALPLRENDHSSL